MNHNSSCVLADRFTEARTLASDLAWILGFSLFTALAAQLEIRLPYTPVPITAQTFAVLLAGALLGSRRGFFPIRSHTRGSTGRMIGRSERRVRMIWRCELPTTKDVRSRPSGRRTGWMITSGTPGRRSG